MTNRDLEDALARGLAEAGGQLSGGDDGIERIQRRIRVGRFRRALVRVAGRRPRVPSRLAGRLTAFAAGLLPAVERARYREEFGSELADIALGGGGLRAQLVYAARTVLSSAWRLRATLRTPRRRGAVR